MEEIREGIKALKEGGIVIFPTDTTFGIGCRIDNEKAIERLFKIRKRPKTQATPVLVNSIEMAQEYLNPIPKGVVDELIIPYWPGALTIIQYCNKAKVPSLVRGGGATLGIRIPNHSTTLALIKGVGVPLLGPSANFHGEKTPCNFEDLDKELVKLADHTVFGQCSLKQQSTVIDCSEKPWKVVRQGALRIQNLSNSFRKKVTIFIDSSSNKEIKVGLEANGKQYTVKRKIGRNKAQGVLTLIDLLLRKKQSTISDIIGIKVNVKHGSFTGVRVGLAVANALSFALKIPVEKV